MPLYCGTNLPIIDGFARLFCVAQLDRAVQAHTEEELRKDRTSTKTEYDIMQMHVMFNHTNRLEQAYNLHTAKLSFASLMAAN